MAPAAYDSISAFLRDTKTKPTDFDLILTGDLGELGHSIVQGFFERDGVDMSVSSSALAIWLRLSSADLRPTSGSEPAP